MTATSSSSILKNKDVQSIFWICLLIFPLLFCLMPYSPLYRYCFSADEVCYRTVSIGLLRGKLPYRDLFDHKGPLTYFIYALGFLISRPSNWGTFIICYLINAAAFGFAYKTARLFLAERESLFSVILLLFFCTMTEENILTTGSKPENLLLLPLMVSVYLFIKYSVTKSAEEKNAEESHVIPCSRMYVIGIMCGAVFMIKLNVCLFYLAFVGCYFLWLLIRKMGKAFLSSVGVFLGGILTVCLPILLFFYIRGGLSSFFDVYIVFNLKYAGGKDSFFYFAKRAIPMTAKVSLTILILFCLLAFLPELLAKKKNVQKIIMFTLGLLVSVLLTAPFVCVYFYIVLVPCFLFGTNFIAKLLTDLLEEKTNAGQLSAIAGFVLVFMIVFQIYLVPYVPSKKTDYEMAIESYAQTHPDATYMTLGSLCYPIFDQHLQSTPEFRMFYMPPFNNDEPLREQMETIASHKADVVVFHESFEDDEWNQSLIRYVEEQGYTSYVAFHAEKETEVTYMFVLK
ncbi:MAG: glycosyltransferase family 39 protein [Clostridiales bacterium]|nr:glycosyltransferase family 39 protein [Clostridiales bacterium]